MSWTDERVALLKKLWGEGKTAAEIAHALGGVTRNAVIGKAHRLKLSNRVSPIQQNNKKPVGKPVEDKPLMRKVANDTAISDMDIEGVSLSELKDKMCRWPIGDPKEPDFRFCGCQSIAGLPYCGDHAKVAYQAATRSRVLQAEDFEERERETEDDTKEAAAG
jgi:GcrA cell cycle regulator